MKVSGSFCSIKDSLRLMFIFINIMYLICLSEFLLVNSERDWMFLVKSVMRIMIIIKCI